MLRNDVLNKIKELDFELDYYVSKAERLMPDGSYYELTETEEKRFREIIEEIERLYSLYNRILSSDIGVSEHHINDYYEQDADMYNDLAHGG